MHSDISRTTFSATHGYRAVQLQQGRVLLDADVNEQAAITAHHDEIRSRDIIGPSGGALPEDPSGPGPFALVGSAGTVPTDTTHPHGVPWAELGVTGGRYYVDGVAAESFPPDGVWPLAGQLFGSPEPPPETPGTRIALYLEVAEHTVTADEQPDLLESALGGPDTTVRQQTSWRVLWRPLTTELCPDLDAAFFAREPRPMVASIVTAPASADPCTITASGGYRRLENQLYRVQVHETVADGGADTYLWSRENGAVVARLLDIADLPPHSDPAEPLQSRLSIDRDGRDEDLDFATGDVVELTGPGRVRERRPGVIATVVARNGLDLIVTWADPDNRPQTVADVDPLPLARRWEGGPRPMTTSKTELEEGISVEFPTTGTARVGDYWQIPARAVRLAYGISATAGTIEWPPPGTPDAAHGAAPPLGPVTRCAPLGILTRVAGSDGEEGEDHDGGWVLEHDCRALFPPLTGLITLDLIGGDGQECLPGAWLDQPVHVALRRGHYPVAGGRIRAYVSDGGLLAPQNPGEPSSDEVLAFTGADGVVGFQWQLKENGPVTQVLEIQWVNDYDVVQDVTLRATARLSVSTQVAHQRAGCDVFTGVATVSDALNALASHPELRLQGGDGQTIEEKSLVLPHPIRVIVDSDCGPVADDIVVVQASENAHIREAVPGEPTPDELLNDPTSIEVTTAPDGSAMVWWQPQSKPRRADTLTLRRLHDETGRAPIVVTAQHPPRVMREVHDGAHIVGIELGARETFPNDEAFTPHEFIEGLRVDLDEEPAVDMDTEQRGGIGHPALWLELDLPWPFEKDGSPWGSSVIGTRTVRPEGRVFPREHSLWWEPTLEVRDWMKDGGPLWWFLNDQHGKKWFDRHGGIPGRVVFDGSAVLTSQGRAVNTHTTMELEQREHGIRMAHRFPSDDNVAGGTFVQWFTLVSATPPRKTVPRFVDLLLSEARKLATDENLTLKVEGPDIGRTVHVIDQNPAEGAPVPRNSTITITTSPLID